MKIILCYPPNKQYQGYGQDTRWLPLGIASIGAYLKDKDKNLDIVLLDLFNETYENAYNQIISEIEEGKTNIIGFTLMTEQRINVFNLCKDLKNYESTLKAYNKKDSKIKTVIGGPHAFIMTQQIINNYSYIDHVIRGEGEQAFYNLINDYKIDNNTSKIYQSEPIKDLDSLPHAIDGFKLFRVIPKFDEAPIITSRGCTDYCSFCSTTAFWKGYRTRSASNVFNEMLKYYTEYNITYFKFHDDACTANIENLKNLCRMIITLEYNQKWKFELTARADQFDNDLIELLKIAGCKQVALGIESGNEDLRKAMNKKLDIDLAKQNMKKLMQVGIDVGMLLIVGYKGETDNTIKETVNLIREVKPTLTFKQPLMIFPGTKIYNDLKKDKLIDDNYWLQDRPQPYYYQIKSKDLGKNSIQINKWINDINKALQHINILIAVPARQKIEKFKLHYESLNRLKIPEYVNVSKLFVLHNSDDLENVIEKNQNTFIHKLHTEEKYNTDGISHDWKHENLKMITDIKNSIVETALKSNFDYILWVDSDLILHEDTLLNLYKANKDIVSEIFWTDWNKSGNLQPNAWDLDHYSFYKDTMGKYKQKGLYKCGGTGACILVNTNVYKSGVNYNPISNVSFWGEDRAFSIRAYVAGFEMFVDTNSPAFHIYRNEDIEEGKNICKKCLHKLSSFLECECKDDKVLISEDNKKENGYTVLEVKY